MSQTSPTTTNIRDLTLAALAFGAVCALAAPAHAAVIRSAPFEAVFASELRFVPESNAAFAFDSSLGTLDSVTLSFDGTMTVSVLTAVTEASPATATTTLSVRYGGRTAATLDPIAVPLTYTERAVDGTTSLYPYTARGSASGARSFEVSIPAEQYGSSGAFFTDYRFVDFRPGTYSSVTDAVFRGTVTALFDYTPVGSEGDVVLADAPGTAVPEPASFALLGLGLAGLAVARRRMA